LGKGHAERPQQWRFRISGRMSLGGNSRYLSGSMGDSMIEGYFESLGVTGEMPNIDPNPKSSQINSLAYTDLVFLEDYQPMGIQ
jgi:hypothetical protein